MPNANVRVIWIALMASAAALGHAVPAALAQDAAPGFTRSRSVEPYRPARSRTQPDGFGDSSAAPDLPAPNPSDDVSTGPQEADDLDPQPRAGQRTVRQDGDLSDPEAPVLRDGVIDTGEPAAPVDGGDPTTIDSRPREEAQLFEAPASTVDALLFQVEELEPILDRRPQRLFRFEPYDPIGVKVGSFVLFPEVEFGGAANSNVFRAPHARADSTFDVRPSARLVSNWQRHALEFSARGTASFYNEFSTENEKSYTLEARGRLDLTKRTNIQASVSRDVSQESRSVLEARSVGTRADVITDVTTAALNHRFNRLSLQLRGSVTDRAYGDSTSAGTTVANDSRDYTTYEEAVRATWEFKPTLAAFTEVGINLRDYKGLDGGGIDRSSTGERYRVGLSFGNTGEFLRGEIGAGWGVQHPSDTSLPDVSGVIVDANLTYRPNALTSFAFAARSDFGETTAAAVGGVRSQFAGVEVRHAFQRNLIGTAGLGYTLATYPGSTLSEDELRSTLGLEYFLNRETVLFSKYAHTAFTSNAANASYDADEVRVGVRIRR
ncbi:MAG: outer membrane beta-barrel protein [Hyphomicrobiaceae bacterium]